MPKNILMPVAVTLALAGMAGSANADLVISKKPTSNMSCSDGICNATAADAVLNVKDLTTMLATSDVHVFAEGAATDITVADPFGWASANKLTLGAYGSLNVKAAISVTGTSGLTITTNAADTGGLFRLVGVGKISFWDTDSTLVINGTTYTLINSVSSLADAIAVNPSGNYAFAKDYNAAQDGSYPHSPIPTTFNGILEGLGNAISNLTIYTPNSESIALFSQVGATGQLSDINLANVSMQSNNDSLAPLVVFNYGTVTHTSASGAISAVSGGYLGSAAGLIDDNEGTITRSHTAVNISGSSYGGGLAAMNNGTISSSDSSGPVSANLAGGLVETNNGTISDSNASGTISAMYQGGGLVSEMLAGIISNAYASGNVTISRTDSVSGGGLVGIIDAGSVQGCFAIGAVKMGSPAPTKRHSLGGYNPQRRPSGNHLGGLVGYSNGSIAYAYATGSVAGRASPQGRTSSVGGLVGRAGTSSSIEVSYSLGQVTLNAKKSLGGIIGMDKGPGNNARAYWDFDTSGITNPYQGAGNVPADEGLKGLSDKQFRNGGLLHRLGNSWAQNPDINNSYPYLINNPPPQ